jgi:hypothetical protein
MKKYDVVVFNYFPSHWQSVKLVIDEFVKSYEYNLLIINKFSRLESHSNLNFPSSAKVLYSKRIESVKFIKSTIIYTAYVGLPRYLLPKNTLHIHQLLSLAGLDNVYSKNTFDSSDFIICATSFQIDDFVRWSSRNENLRGIHLVKGGYPKLDILIRDYEDSVYQDEYLETIVYAPTHVYNVNENLATLRSDGIQIIQTILDLGVRLIFRPHPVSLLDPEDKIEVNKIVDYFKDNPKFECDYSNYYFETYSKSSIMITDLSGTGVTYNLGFLKPTIFYSREKQLPNLDSIVRDIKSLGIGDIVCSSEELVQSVNYLIRKDCKKSILEFRKDLIFNVGTSNIYIASTISSILMNNYQKDWHLL